MNRKALCSVNVQVTRNADRKLVSVWSCHDRFILQQSKFYQELETQEAGGATMDRKVFREAVQVATL